MITEAMREAAAFALLRALHDKVPEDQKPMAWMDCSSDQEYLIRKAAVAALEAADAAAWHPWSETPPTNICILVEDMTAIGPIVMWCRWVDRRGCWLAQNHIALVNPRRWRTMPLPPPHQEDTDAVRPPDPIEPDAGSRDPAAPPAS